MRARTLFLAVCITAVCLTGTGAYPVLAHASLVRCSIKNHQVFRAGHAPRKVVAHFAEDVNPDHSWMKVFEGVADHGLVEPEHYSISFKNAKVMTLTLPKLKPLRYYLLWYTHSEQDGHYAAGIVYFRVKR